MRILLDTNIVLELILGQERADDVRSLLMQTDQHQLFISDFSVHSIGLLLFRRKQKEAFREFLDDLLVDSNLAMIGLTNEQMGSIIDVAEQFALDFDDAYQYGIAVKHNLIIVSFDADFDRTDRGRKTPEIILRQKTGQ
jgi:predicted nucleic acid-binding protein